MVLAIRWSSLLLVVGVALALGRVPLSASERDTPSATYANMISDEILQYEWLSSPLGISFSSPTINPKTPPPSSYDSLIGFQGIPVSVVITSTHDVLLIFVDVYNNTLLSGTFHSITSITKKLQATPGGSDGAAARILVHRAGFYQVTANEFFVISSGRVHWLEQLRADVNDNGQHVLDATIKQTIITPNPILPSSFSVHPYLQHTMSAVMLGMGVCVSHDGGRSWDIIPSIHISKTLWLLPEDNTPLVPLNIPVTLSSFRAPPILLLSDSTLSLYSESVSLNSGVDVATLVTSVAIRGGWLVVTTLDKTYSVILNHISNSTSVSADESHSLPISIASTPFLPYFLPSVDESVLYFVQQSAPLPPEDLAPLWGTLYRVTLGAKYVHNKVKKSLIVTPILYHILFHSEEDLSGGLHSKHGDWGASATTLIMGGEWGTAGIMVATVVSNAASLSAKQSTAQFEYELSSRVSMDGGLSWVIPLLTNPQGVPIPCVYTTTCLNCQFLLLVGGVGMDYPEPATSEAAPGVVLANAQLSPPSLEIVHPTILTVISLDGGWTWQVVAVGPSILGVGSSVLVRAPWFVSDDLSYIDTKTIWASTDSGANWSAVGLHVSASFPNFPVIGFQLTSFSIPHQPSATTVVVAMGSLFSQGDPPRMLGTGVVWLDPHYLYEGECTPSMIEHHPLCGVSVASKYAQVFNTTTLHASLRLWDYPTDTCDCVKGQKLGYYRRVPGVSCYPPLSFRPHATATSIKATPEICKCTVDNDYECMPPFERGGNVDGGACVIPSSIPPSTVLPVDSMYDEMTAEYLTLSSTIYRNDIISKYTVGVYSLCALPHSGDTVPIISGYVVAVGNRCKTDILSPIVITCAYHSGTMLPVVIAVIVIVITIIVIGFVLFVRFTVRTVYRRLASTDTDTTSGEDGIAVELENGFGIDDETEGEGEDSPERGVSW